MAVSTANAPRLTAEQVQSILVEAARAGIQSFLSAGPRIFDTDGSPVRVPKLGGGYPDWKGENEQIDNDDVSFDEVVLLPSTIKSVKTLTRFSNELARQSSRVARGRDQGSSREGRSR